MSKMSASEIVAAAKKFRESYPKEVVYKIPNKYIKMRSEIIALIRESAETREQLAKKLDITPATLYSKMRKPELWKEQEVIKLLDMFY